MNRPRISLGSVLLVVFAVAADCVAMRSLHVRPMSDQGAFEVAVLAWLPMANLLAVMLTVLLWERRARRAFRVGFVGGGGFAAAITALGARPALSWLDASLQPTDLGAWLAASPARGMAIGYVVLPGLALLSQLLIALAAGWTAMKLAREVEAPVEFEPTRRWGLASALTMMFLIAAPAMGVEGSLRWAIDPRAARLPVGSMAVVDVRVMNGWRITIEDGTTRMLTNGSEVRVVDDTQPTVLAGIMTPNGEQTGDHRSVRVTLRDGEPTSLPRQFLRAVR